MRNRECGMRNPLTGTQSNTHTRRPQSTTSQDARTENQKNEVRKEKNLLVGFACCVPRRGLLIALVRHGSTCAIAPAASPFPLVLGRLGRLLVALRWFDLRGRPRRFHRLLFFHFFSCLLAGASIN